MSDRSGNFGNVMFVIADFAIAAVTVDVDRPYTLSPPYATVKDWLPASTGAKVSVALPVASREAETVLVIGITVGTHGGAGAFPQPAGFCATQDG